MSRSDIFVVAFDILDPRVQIEGVKELLTSSREITAWWNHIPGCYLVATDMTPDEITDKFKMSTHDARLLVMKVVPETSEGWLPERSWRWIRKREAEKAN